MRVTRPFSFLGSRIEGATLRFSGGKVVDFDAKAGLDALRSLLNTDEGARRLGEVSAGSEQFPDFSIRAALL